MLSQSFEISTGGNSYVASPITVEKGELQGDCLSPLIFNMCVNTLFKQLMVEK